MPFIEIRSGERPVISSPLNRMRPEVGASTPVRQLKNVLLPAPFGPIIARISSAVDLEIDVVDRGEAAKAARQPFRAQHGAYRADPGLVGRGGQFDSGLSSTLTSRQTCRPAGRRSCPPGSSR